MVVFHKNVVHILSMQPSEGGQHQAKTVTLFEVEILRHTVALYIILARGKYNFIDMESKWGT